MSLRIKSILVTGAWLFLSLVRAGAALTIGGCGEQQPLIIVQLRNVTSNIKTIGVGVALNSHVATNPQLFEDRRERFGVWLPAHATGAVKILVLTWDAQGCSISRGSADVGSVEDGVQNVSISLAGVPRQCN